MAHRELYERLMNELLINAINLKLINIKCHQLDQIYVYDHINLMRLGT